MTDFDDCFPPLSSLAGTKAKKNTNSTPEFKPVKLIVSEPTACSSSSSSTLPAVESVTNTARSEKKSEKKPKKSSQPKQDGNLKKITNLLFLT